MPSPVQRSIRRRVRPRRPLRDDQWRKGLDDFIWLQRMAGISEKTLLKAARASLARCRGLRSVRVPPLSVLLYSEIVSTWLYRSEYLDKDTGRPKPLPLEGKISFASLVRIAGIDASPGAVAKLLARVGVIQQDINGYLRLVTDYVVPVGQRFVPERLRYGLIALNALLGTLRVTVRSTKSTSNRIQRLVWVENLHPDLLRDYDKFQRDTVETLLESHEAWFRAHTKRSPRGKRLMGIQVNAFDLPSK